MELVKNSKVIMVHSYKEGTGKTAIAINLARHLAIKLQKKVLLFKQDTGGSSFSTIFRVTPELTWNDFYSSSRVLKDLIVKSDLFDIICSTSSEIPIPEGLKPEVFYTRQFERLALQKKWLIANYEYIILDIHPGYTIELLNSILITDIAVLVTWLDVDTTENTIDMYNKVYSQFQEKRIILVQNQVHTP